MKTIDFINDCEYQKKDTIKIALIMPDGTIYIADISNDNKTYNTKFPYKKQDHNILTNHIDYLYILIHKYFKDDKTLISLVDKGNFAIFIELIKRNIIIFNNFTMYDSILYLINNNTEGRLQYNEKKITKEQLEALKELTMYLKDFTTISVDKLQIIEDNIEEYEELSDKGITAIKTFLSMRGFGTNEKNNHNHNR